MPGSLANWVAECPSIFQSLYRRLIPDLDHHKAIRAVAHLTRLNYIRLLDHRQRQTIALLWSAAFALQNACRNSGEVTFAQLESCPGAAT